MFSRISRYQKLPDVVTTDSQGRTLPSKTLRRLPQVSGTFLHTVEEVDRLDHLAYKYYQQPRRWWRISDANPEFMSPQALLGKGPVVTDRFPLTFNSDSAQPPWSALVRNLTNGACVKAIKVGAAIEAVKIVEEIRLVPHPDTVYVQQFERAVEVTYNQMSVSAENLISHLQDVGKTLGFEVLQPERIGRVGKHIIIPRDVIG